jgi:hypothetical protein
MDLDPLKVKATNSFGTFKTTCQATQHHIPKDHNPCLFQRLKKLFVINNHHLVFYFQMIPS